MTAKPIIFSAPMIRALLDGRKTQTRRIYRVPPGSYVEQGRIWAMTDGCPHGDAALPYAPGDRLWVREAWAVSGDFAAINSFDWAKFHDPRRMFQENLRFRADADAYETAVQAWRPPIHMPRWASRLTLIVTEVRVQRLQEISRGDAMEEGCPFANMADGPNPRDWYRDIWNSIHGPDAWDANPWVAALTFTVHRQNIDQMEPTK